MTQEEIEQAAIDWRGCSESAYTTDAFKAGAKWHQRKVEEAFKQWLSEHIAFTADYENRTILQELWDKINV